MADPNDNVLRKARALLAQAQHQNTSPEEAEAFTERAMQLVAKHRIGEALLQDGQVTSTHVGDTWIQITPPYTAEQFTLLAAIATCLGGKAIALTDWKYGAVDKKTGERKKNTLWGGGCRVHVFGFAGDLERIEFLFTHLYIQASSGMLRATPPPGQRRSDYNSEFLQGFTSAVQRRLWEIRRRAQRDADTHRPGNGNGRGTELVLADRGALVDQRFKTAYPGQGDPVKLYQGDGAGRSAGYQTGLEADLDHTRVTTEQGQRALPAAR